MRRLVAIMQCLIITVTLGLGAVADETGFVEHINMLAGDARVIGGKVTLKGTDRLTTKASFHPPVEIDITAKTDSTNLRIAYAADQIIFNWEGCPAELRVDGGPAGGKHRAGSGQIPRNKFVTVKWLVLPTKQQVFVDGDLRFEHQGDYSQVLRPVSVFCYESRVTVTSIRVRSLPEKPDAKTRP